MFLHIGAEYSVPVKDIALILDCGAKTLITKKIIDAGGARRSAILTADTIYYSPIAAGTLCKRLNKLTKTFYITSV